jgi:hypothetical protein
MGEITMNRKIILVSLGTAAAAGAAYALWLRPRHLRWGATDSEVEMPLLGDDLTPDARGQLTHAITIDAPVSEVWPWLAQVGQDKGGFYSYSWLENLVGCNMHNATSIVPDFQHLQVGDKLWLHPKGPPLPVLVVEPERAIVFGSNTSEPGTWGVYLQPVGENSTRLIARGRGDWNPTLLRQMFNYAVFEPAHFLMERKMLLTIKHLSEAKSGAVASMRMERSG